jgi:ketosteroid isomerase-like protein
MSDNFLPGMPRQFCSDRRPIGTAKMEKWTFRITTQPGILLARVRNSTRNRNSAGGRKMSISGWASLLLSVGLFLGVAEFAIPQNPEESKQTDGEAILKKELQNSKTILAIFRAIEERNDAQPLQFFQPDFEIHWPPSLPYGGTFTGLKPSPNGWSATWEPLQPTEAERKMDAQVVSARGDDVVVLWRQRGLSPRGDRFDGEVLSLYRFREGKLARAQMFYFDTTAVATFLARPKRP